MVGVAIRGSRVYGRTESARKLPTKSSPRDAETSGGVAAKTWRSRMQNQDRRDAFGRGQS